MKLAYDPIFNPRQDSYEEAQNWKTSRNSFFLLLQQTKDKKGQNENLQGGKFDMKWRLALQRFLPSNSAAAAAAAAIFPFI